MVAMVAWSLQGGAYAGGLTPAMKGGALHALAHSRDMLGAQCKWQPAALDWQPCAIQGAPAMGSSTQLLRHAPPIGDVAEGVVRSVVHKEDVRETDTCIPGEVGACMTT